MLAGLVHQIGALPVLARIDELLGSDAAPSLIDALVSELAPELGNHILATWHFPDALAGVPKDCLDVMRQGERVDYADVVLVARLQYAMGTGQLPADMDLGAISAFSRVELEPEVVVMDMEGPAEEIAEVQALFST
jgi:HD-like signal output (HDOD) protein